MTGKQQKAKAVTEDFLKRVELSQEEKIKIMDEAIIEVHGENAEFLEKFKMPIKAFRGMYIVHTFFSMVDNLIKVKTQEKLNEKVNIYKEEEAAKKRRKFK